VFAHQFLYDLVRRLTVTVTQEYFTEKENQERDYAEPYLLA